VEVLKERPSRHFIELGKVTGHGAKNADIFSNAGAVQNARRLAADMGADAIILETTGKETVNLFGGKTWFVTATAIKYQ
jgi:DhnA family fructose-bisphosphate aldolase class Ia